MAKHKPLNPELVTDSIREAVLIGKIATIKGLAPWVIERIRPAVNLLDVLEGMESELEALTTQK